MKNTLRVSVLIVASLLALAGCGKSTVVNYEYDYPDGVADAETKADAPVEPDAPVVPEGDRYRIKLLEDTTQPLELFVGDHEPIQAWVFDTLTNQDAVNYQVTYQIIKSDPECDESPPCGQFKAKQAFTDAMGKVSVTFEAGTEGEVLYDVKLIGNEAMPDAMQIKVSDPPVGTLRVNLEYFGPVAIHSISVRLMKGKYSCGDFNPVNPWVEVDSSKFVSGIDSTPGFEGLPVDDTYLVFATALGPTDHLTAEGCTDAIHVLSDEGGETNVTLELDPVILNPAGTYNMTSRFNFQGAIPGEAGEIVDLVVDLFTDPGSFIIDMVKLLVSSYIGDLATDVVFGLFEDALGDIITDWLLSNPNSFVTDFFTIGGDLIQIVHHVELTSELKLSKLTGDFYFQGVQSWQGINLYWKLGCDPDSPDYEECGKYPFSLEDLEDTDMPIDLLTGQFTGMIANYDQLIIDKHIVELNYGKLILFVLNELLIPAISDFESLEDALYSIIDCASIADQFDNGILEPLGIDKDKVEDFCNQAENALFGPIEEIIGNLALDSKLRIHGKCTMLDEDDNLMVDKLQNGLWWGHIEIQSEEGAEFEGEFEAEKAEFPGE